jgi:hypothetical protein
MPDLHDGFDLIDLILVLALTLAWIGEPLREIEANRRNLRKVNADDQLVS